MWKETSEPALELVSVSKGTQAGEGEEESGRDERNGNGYPDARPAPPEPGSSPYGAPEQENTQKAVEDPYCKHEDPDAIPERTIQVRQQHPGNSPEADEPQQAERLGMIHSKKIIGYQTSRLTNLSSGAQG